MNSRYPLFDVPHKALRMILSKLVHKSGTIDFNVPEQATEFAVLFREVHILIYSHSHHEDNLLFTELDKIAPGQTSHDREEHDRLHRDLDVLMELIETLAAQSGKVLITDNEVNELYKRLCQLHAEMLIHMMEEETITQPVFWEYMTDEELASFQPRILGSMTPEVSALWLKYIFPSHAVSAVARMLMGMKETMPEHVYDNILQIAREALSDKAYEELMELLQQEEAAV